MNARALSLASWATRPSTRYFVLRTPVQRRFASTQQQPSHLSQFYKTFTRPVAKVLLTAFFTYQLAYWVWAKLESDEIMAEREAYIAELENEVTKLAVSGHKQETAPHEPSPLDYQAQLAALERQNKRRLAAIAKAEEEETKGQETSGQKKTSH